MTRIEPEVVSDVEEKHRAAYDEVVRQLLADADVVFAASPEDRRYMEEKCEFSFENFEVARRELEKQRTGSAPPDPLLLRAAAKRVAGIKPIEPEADPGQSPSLAKVYLAALRCRNTLYDDVIREEETRHQGGRPKGR